MGDLVDPAQGIYIRRFEIRDQDIATAIYRSGFVLYHSLGPDVVTLQKLFVDSKVGPGGDMHNIFESYEIEKDPIIASSNFWVAVDLTCDKVVGCLGILPSEMYENSGELVRMSVDEGYRKRGIAGRLLEEASLWAKIRGLKTIHLKTLTLMTPAINLYLKNGFTRTHDELYVWPGFEFKEPLYSACMIKEINP